MPHGNTKGHLDNKDFHDSKADLYVRYLVNCKEEIIARLVLLKEANPLHCMQSIFTIWT